MTGRTMQPADLLNILRRPREILIPFFLITLATAPVIRMLPNHYRSETLIMVVPQRLSESYVRSTVTTKIEDRLRSLNQQVTSRSHLEPVITELNLYPESAGRVPMQDRVERMRTDIRIDIIRNDAFRISYTSKDPRTAMLVTGRLASIYIDESRRDREAVADRTNDFLDTQLAEAKAKLDAQQLKVEEYKRQYGGQLPTQVQGNLQVMQNMQLQIQSVLDSTNRDRDRLLMLQRQLPDTADPVNGRKPAAAAPSPAAEELTKATAALAEMRQRLLDTHPDVIRQQRVVAELQKTAAEATAPDTDTRQAPDGGGLATAAANAASTQLQAEISTITKRIEQKSREEARLRSVVADYQSRVAAAPTRESQLADLMRDSETLERGYTSLLARKDDAQVSANLERRQIGEQFKVLDPPFLPETPVSPRRLPMYAAGAGLGLFAGLLLAGFLEFRDTSLKTDAEVVSALTLPVLAIIPEMPDVSRGRKGWWR